MDTQLEPHFLAQLRQVSEAADRLLAFFPNRTQVPELEDLRHKVRDLKAELYCEFCGADQLAHPDHIGTCARCHGALHHHGNQVTCEKCGYFGEVDRKNPFARVGDG
jgi:hypothetical protein